MPRPRKTDRVDIDVEDDSRDPSRDARPSNRKQFENEMFPDEVTSPFHISRDLWPDGKAIRWISIEVTGAPDNRNWSLKTASHWTPIQRGKYPQIDERIPSVPMPGVSGGASVNIIYGGLCLCERDIRLTYRDKRAQEKATEDAQRTIESYVEGGSSAVPRFNQSSPVQFERGRAQFKE